MSVAQGGYIAVLAKDITGKDNAEAKTGKYFGIFLAAYQSGKYPKTFGYLLLFRD